MKQLVSAPLFFVLIFCAISGCSRTPSISADAPIVYINTNIGFESESYAYVQPEMICNIDEELIDDIVERGARENIRITPVSGAEIDYKNHDVLALDLTRLGSGPSSGDSYKGSQIAPTLGILAVYIGGNDAVSESKSYKKPVLKLFMLANLLREELV